MHPARTLIPSPVHGVPPPEEELLLEELDDEPPLELLVLSPELPELEPPLVVAVHPIIANMVSARPSVSAATSASCASATG